MLLPHALVAGALFCATTTPAEKTPEQLLAEANEAVRALELNLAKQLAQQALERGNAKLETVWQLHGILGRVRAAMGFPDAAMESFGRALELHPSFELPPGASPKLLEPFRRAREELGGARLVAVVHTARIADGVLRTTVVPKGDRYHVVDGGRLYLRDGEAWTPRTLSLQDTFTTTWSCAQPSCPHFVALLDASGNEVVRVGSSDAPLLPEGAGQAVTGPPAVLVPIAPPRDPPRPWYQRAGPYLTAAAVASAVVAAVFAFRFLEAEKRLLAAADNPGSTSYAALRGLDGTRQGAYAVMWASGGLAVALGGTAIFFW